MCKSILVLGLFFTASALAQSKCPGECRINVPSTSVCIVQQDPAQCLKIKECTLNEMNCARRRQNIPLLSRSKIERCSLIRSATGSGRCSAVKKCQNMKCDNDKVVRCQQAGKQCRLLTNCAARKENCNRPPNNQMQSVGFAACKGFKRTEGFKLCKPMKRKKKKKVSNKIKKVLKG
ncbi:PREDICTED: uncharacterized protein LOC108964937 [Bactrocera latifrons]|uniref:uncharacterized protein LOC108964937 n=1 Tax=Bactrocera latifrons TaxID=174628 RepID=UPI0008DC8BB2|nr:PREDICTED: uncharacterized protein LOC108964937 [Bactrocera latifrons]